MTDCKLSKLNDMEFSKKLGCILVACEFNTPRIKKDLANNIGDKISFFEEDYIIYGIETYAIPDDREVYGCTLMLKPIE